MAYNERNTIHFWERILDRIAIVLYRVTIYFTAARYLKFHTVEVGEFSTLLLNSV